MKQRDRLIQRWMRGEVRVVGSDARLCVLWGKAFRLVHLSDGSKVMIEAPRG